MYSLIFSFKSNIFKWFNLEFGNQLMSVCLLDQSQWANICVDFIYRA